MFSQNRVTLIGHIGNVEIRDGEKKVAKLSLYTSESWKDKETGERQEKTERHDLVAFRPGLVKLIEGHIEKGAYLHIEGSIHYSKWTDKDGKDRYSTEIVVNSIGFLSAKPRDDTASDQDNNPTSGNNDMDDEIPF